MYLFKCTKFFLLFYINWSRRIIKGRKNRYLATSCITISDYIHLHTYIKGKKKKHTEFIVFKMSFILYFVQYIHIKLYIF